MNENYAVERIAGGKEQLGEAGGLETRWEDYGGGWTWKGGLVNGARFRSEQIGFVTNNSQGLKSLEKQMREEL